MREMPDSPTNSGLNRNRPFLFLLTSHWVSLLGAALVTTAGFSWLFVLPLHMRGSASNPYIGLLAFIGIPIVFFAGLALIPVGIFLAKRRIAAGLGAVENRRGMIQRIAIFVGALTVINIVIGTQVTYRAVQHMETNQFCGATCHVMKPEFTAHLTGPHQSVGCTDCHITPGATGWIKSKIAGSRQMELVLLNSFPRPIPSAMESDKLAPSVDTCEQCHSRARVVGPRLRVISKFKDDEANTPEQTVLMMSVGGGNTGGIHGVHMGPGVVMRYAAADAKRQTIPWVEYTNTSTKETRTYLAAGTKPEAIAGMKQFEMQCVDCHNRPTHAFDLPERAVDKAMAAGLIPLGLPFAKKTAVAVLTATYATEDEALRKIPAAFSAFYQQKYPDVWGKRSNDVDRAGHAVLALYQRNVFQDLKVGWGTYVDNLGHMDSPGCFRCHDESHATAAKKTITQDCSTCHNPLAVEETSPDVLKTLGIADKIASLESH
jgi:mono/diheme cytochrome c family protein